MVPGLGYGASAVKFGKWGGKASDFFKTLFSKGSTVFKKCNSFTPQTPVLMADGRTKPIKDIRVGDRVLATDPATDETSPRPVDQLLTTTGQKSLVSITVDEDGAAGDSVGTFTATAAHPVWLANRKAWVDAENIVAGDRVRTPDGTTAAVVATRDRDRVQQVFNLTVRDIHTYYVLAGRTPVLVHNATCPVTFADMGGDHFMSPGGLVYGPGAKGEHKIDHVLAHTVANPNKPNHTVFVEKSENRVLDLVDEAWTKQGQAIRPPDDPYAWVIPMGKVIGTQGETYMRIAKDPNSDLILSAYPVTYP